MPYTVSKDENGQFCVFKADEQGEPTGETLGCHDTAEQAGAQIGAIENSEEGRAVPEMEHTGVFAYARAFRAKEQPADGRVWYVAATEGVKRDGLDLKMSDFTLDQFREYPIILYGHDYLGRNLPIGLGEPQIVGRELHMGIAFDEADPFAMQVKHKAERGMIAGSIGWEDVEVKGKTLHNLMEFSLVPMPADPKSLPIKQARALRSLADALEAIDTDDSQPTPTAEPDWREVAAAMVAVLSPSGDDAEAARLETYKSLLPKYRRLNKTAPEYLDAATLSALDVATRRGLFLAGEPELLPDLFIEPEPPKADAAETDKALTAIQARLAALEQRPPAVDTRTLEGIIARLEGLGTRSAPAPVPEPPAAQRAAGGDDGKGTVGDASAAPIDNALQAILEKLESRK